MIPFLPLILKYKYILVGAVAVALLGGSFNMGYKVAAGSCEKDKRKALEELIEYQAGIQRENDVINAEIISELTIAENEVREELREVIRYVESNPDLSDCVLDADGLSIWNGGGGGD